MYQLLKDNRGQLDKLSDALLEREELDRDDVAKLLGLRPDEPRTTSGYANRLFPTAYNYP